MAAGGHPGPEWLGAYHDGELTGPAATTVARHLEECPACRERVADLARIDRFGAWLEESDPAAAVAPADLEDLIRRRLARETDPLDSADAASGAALAAAGRPVTKTTTVRALRPERRGGFSWRWGLATAATLTLVVISVQLIERRSIVQMVNAPAEGGREMNDAASDPLVAARAEQPGPPDRARGKSSPAESSSPARGSLGTESDRATSGPAGGPPSGEPQPRPPAAEQTGSQEAAMADNSPEAAPAFAAKEDAAPGLAVSPAPATRTADAASASSPTSAAESGVGADRDLPASTRPGAAGQTESAAEARHEQGVTRAMPPITQTPSDRTADRDHLASGFAAEPGAGSGSSGVAAGGAPAGYAADVDRELGNRPEPSKSPPHGRLEVLDRLARRALDSAADAPRPPLADYQIAMAAAMRAAEAGRYELARRGFRIVMEGIPDEALAREAEYEWRLAGYHQDLGSGGAVGDVLARAGKAADSSWQLARAAGFDSTTQCRQALADLRAWLALVHEKDPAAPLDEAERRLRELQSCAR